VHAGEIWLDNRMTAEVMRLSLSPANPVRAAKKPLLSDREKEIVQLVAQGFRNKEIGEKLFISEQTAKTICTTSSTSSACPTASSWRCMPSTTG